MAARERSAATGAFASFVPNLSTGSDRLKIDPGWGSISPPPGALTNPRPFNGGDDAWGGLSIGDPAPPIYPSHDVAMKASAAGRTTNIGDGEKAVWEGGRWIIEAGRKVIGLVRLLHAAKQIYDRTKVYWPPHEEPPPRIETRWQHFGNMLYRHPGDYWLEYPPPGYGANGEALWKLGY
jgi:hypothetical protein